MNQAAQPVRSAAPQPPAYNPAEESAMYHEFEELSKRIVKRPLILFFGRSTFSDNTKYLYLATVEAARDHQVVWCTWSKPLAAKLNSRGLRAFDLGADANAAITLLLEAAVAVFCENPAAALGLSSPMSGALAGARKVQLWHGVSVKQLDLMLIRHLNICESQFRRQLRFATRVDHFLSTSSHLDAFWLRAFGCTSLLRAGQPRNEVIVRKPTELEMIDADLPANLEQILKSGDARKLLLAPTWQRGKPLYIWTQPFFERLARWATKNEAYVFIKLHPFLVRADLPSTVGERVFILNAGVDIYPWMSRFDALITDYSSIMFDYLLTGRPVFTFNSRTQVSWGFEPDYSLIPEGEFRYEFDQSNFEAVVDANLDRHPLAESQREFAGKLFETSPADACAQLIQVILEMSRTAQDKDYTLIAPPPPAQLTRIAV